MPSFDVVSEVDIQEVDNAVNQARKELTTRYDLKNSKCEIEFDRKNLTIVADDKMKLKALQEIINLKMTKRGIGVRALDYKDPEEAMGGSLRQKIEIRQGIATDDARKIVKIIKDASLKKVQAQIQDEQVRITGPKRDDLQSAIAVLKEKVDWLELQYTNFRD